MGNAVAGYLGLGINSLEGETRGITSTGTSRAIEGKEISNATSANTVCRIARGASELSQAMQQMSTFSLSGLSFLTLLEEKKGFIKSLKTTVFSLSVVVQCWHSTESSSLIEPHLAVETNGLDLDEFVRLYGDSYISQVNMGGEFIGVFTFRSETREEANTVEASLRAGGLIKGIGIGAGFHQALEEVSRNSKIDYEFLYHVSGATKPQLRPQDIAEYALAFNATMIERPTVLDLTATGYEKVPGISSLFDPVAKNRDLFTGSGGLIRQQTRIEGLQNQIKQVKHRLRAYGVTLPDEVALDSAMQMTIDDLQALHNLKKVYLETPSVELELPRLESLRLGTPQLAATVISDPSTCVGDPNDQDGTPFAFPYDHQQAVRNGVRIKGLALETGRLVDKLVVHYCDQKGTVEVHEYGGSQGKDSGSIELNEGEGINEIYSEFGTGLDKLLLTTDRLTLGGGGNRGDRDHPVHWQRAHNQTVLGFSGRSDNHPKGVVQQLTATVATFEGIRWEEIPEDHLLETRSQEN